MENPTHDTPALIHDAPALEALKDTLDALVANLMDDSLVPERYTSSLAGLLSEADDRTITEASAVLHRLALWARYPRSTPEAYTRRADAHSVRA